MKKLLRLIWLKVGKKQAIKFGIDLAIKALDNAKYKGKEIVPDDVMENFKKAANNIKAHL